jgi:endogenous inhibitor of DNA gyrase (YacG/DUF329 family)
MEKCPICSKAADAKYQPFCSRRCADIDLNRWLSGGYAIPGAAMDEDEDGPSSPPETGEGGDRRPN